MTWFYLVVIMLTAQGAPVADIPRPFTSEVECKAEGLKRGAEIAANKGLSHGVWICASVDFDQDDPLLYQMPLAPLEPKREGQ
jgi:hypothetical protein